MVSAPRDDDGYERPLRVWVHQTLPITKAEANAST